MNQIDDKSKLMENIPRELLEFIKIYILSRKLIIANIVGLMGSGKTNIAMLLAYLYSSLCGCKTNIYYIDVDHINRLRKVIEYDQIYPSPAIIILDDLTMLEASRARNENSLAYLITRIRHLLGKDNAFIILIFHYITAVNPILRIANMRILTTVSSFAEIEALRRYFMLSYLTEYLKLKEERWLEYDALLNISGKHVIWLNIPKAPEIETVNIE